MKPVIVTIDTEGHDGSDPVRHLIIGETVEGKYGIERIMDELDSVGVKALFFVDFAEAWDYGEEKIRNVVETILERGHDIGVHIHPDHMADKSKLFLYEYSREEQFDMIKRCTDLYEKMVGRKPLSFRAGKYSANIETLDILDELGYKYDFSAFYHQQWCGMKDSFTINAPCRYKSLIEFPVTMHKSFDLGFVEREDKVDIEQMTCGELRYSLDQIAKQKFPVVVTLFFHSFSLLKWRESPDAPIKNENNIKKLKGALKAVKQHKELKFISEKNLGVVEVASRDEAANSEIVWDSKVKGILYTYRKAISIAKYNKKARLLVLVSFIILFGLLGLVAFLLIQL